MRSCLYLIRGIHEVVVRNRGPKSRIAFQWAPSFDGSLFDLERKHGQLLNDFLWLRRDNLKFFLHTVRDFVCR